MKLEDDVKKSDWLLALIAAVAIPTFLIALSRSGARPMDSKELLGASYLDLDSHPGLERQVWTLYLGGERYVSIFPDGSVELPADLPVDDVAWRFWVALGNTWPDFREQMCGAGWGEER